MNSAELYAAYLKAKSANETKLKRCIRLVERAPDSTSELPADLARPSSENSTA